MFTLAIIEIETYIKKFIDVVRASPDESSVKKENETLPTWGYLSNYQFQKKNLKYINNILKYILISKVKKIVR